MNDVFTFSNEINKRIWDIQYLISILPGGGCLGKLDADLKDVQSEIDDFIFFIKQDIQTRNNTHRTVKFKTRRL